MTDPQPTDPFVQMIDAIALSAARLRLMADEAHALIQHLQSRPPSVKSWANEETRTEANGDKPGI